MALIPEQIERLREELVAERVKDRKRITELEQRLDEAGVGRKTPARAKTKSEPDTPPVEGDSGVMAVGTA